MANIQLIETCTIAEYFICAIEYGDASGLDDEEENLICAWIDNCKEDDVAFPYLPAYENLESDDNCASVYAFFVVDWEEG